jgi:hypothetical protein
MTDPADIALYQAQILTGQVTAPYTYAFNNLDINYTKGQTLREVKFYLTMSDSSPYAQADLLDQTSVGAQWPANPQAADRLFIGWGGRKRRAVSARYGDHRLDQSLRLLDSQITAGRPSCTA